MNLRLSNLSKSYGGQPALQALSLKLESIRSLVLIGPSGGGKSTLLRLLAGLERADVGAIEINGRRMPSDEAARRAFRKTVGVVFQAFNLFPHLDALRNITLPLERVHGVPAPEAAERARHLLDRFRLDSHRHKRPAQLSGGQSQRVAIARALAHDPQLLFFDEPTSALDPEMAAEVLDVIEELVQSGKECVIVTHQMGFARRIGEHVAYLARGAIVEQGSSQAFFAKPASDEARAFLARELRY